MATYLHVSCRFRPTVVKVPYAQYIVCVSTFVATRQRNVTAGLSIITPVPPSKHSATNKRKKHQTDKAIVDIILRPSCAIPPPRSRPIGASPSSVFLKNTTICACLVYPFCCMALLVIEWSLLQRRCCERIAAKIANTFVWPDNPQTLPFSRSASYSVPLLYSGPLRFPKNVKIFPWNFVTPPKKDRTTVIANMHENLVKIARVVPDICSRTYRQTDRHTDALITIPRHRNTKT